MQLLSLFGLFAITAGVVFYALESFSNWFILAFAVACGLASIYAFLQGAWPYGIIEIVWTVVAMRRWRLRRRWRLKGWRSATDENYALGEIGRYEYLQKKGEIIR
jgi:hypothetical protein